MRLRAFTWLIQLSATIASLALIWVLVPIQICQEVL